MEVLLDVIYKRTEFQKRFQHENIDGSLVSCSSKLLVTTYTSTQHHNPEDHPEQGIVFAYACNRGDVIQRHNVCIWFEFSLVLTNFEDFLWFSSSLL
jgi:hypothetical protein